jgi:DNA polymerase II
MSTDVTTIRGTLLTRDYRDQRGALCLSYWLASDMGAVRLVFQGVEARFFVRGRDGSERKSLAGTPLEVRRFSTMSALRLERQRIKSEDGLMYESDRLPHQEFLSERLITGAVLATGVPLQRDGYLEFRDPDIRPAAAPLDLGSKGLSVLSIDLETDGLDGALFSIAAASGSSEKVFLIGEPFRSASPISFCSSERELLATFFGWVQKEDPDILVGWNVVGFDLDFLGRRCRALNVPFSLGRGKSRARVLPTQGRQQGAIARIPGRAVLDGIDTIRTATIVFDEYTLSHVAHEVLGRGKAIIHTDDPAAEIRRMYHKEPEKLCHYNLKDCRLVLEIFERLGLLDFAIERQQLTGLALGRRGGSVAAFDNLYLPRLHEKGVVAPDVRSTETPRSSPGGTVFDSKPGIYKNVLLLDFKSLYPSIIRTFKIDPYGMAFPGDDPIEGFDGAHFAREGSILPELIETLWTARDRAKARQDKAASQSIKILMNSLYGVMGTPFCRFFDWRLVNSITKRGHQILTQSRDYLEAQGIPVIYGDTDSLFLWIGDEHSAQEAEAVGHRLCVELNDFWSRRISEEHRTASHLEVEFETHFRRFLMPTARLSEVGSKKRYAGLSGETLVIKGLEAIRSDWTMAAKTLQRELLSRILNDQPYRDLLVRTAGALRAGELDSELVYRKRLRRDVADYDGVGPPHVQAARKLEKPGRSVHYVMTRRGPEPVRGEVLPEGIDHQHYFDRQLAPAADVALSLLGVSFADVAGKQLNLF